MSKSIFISTVHEDSHLIATLSNWATNNRLGSNISITHETEEDKRHLGKEIIKKHIQKKIEGASIVIVLIGRDTHNHDWIKAEVELANNYNKKIICIRIPQTTGATPPILNKYQVITFEPNTIKMIIEKV
jgi:hypothetical protein